MKLLCQRYFGSIARCDECGAILGYEAKDVFANMKIICPQCKAYVPVLFQVNYEGVIDDGKAVVQQQSGTGTSNSGST